jgi:hypothetical protein
MQLLSLALLSLSLVSAAPFQTSAPTHVETPNSTSNANLQKRGIYGFRATMLQTIGLSYTSPSIRRKARVSEERSTPQGRMGSESPIERYLDSPRSIRRKNASAAIRRMESSFASHSQGRSKTSSQRRMGSESPLAQYRYRLNVQRYQSQDLQAVRDGRTYQSGRQSNQEEKCPSDLSAK